VTAAVIPAGASLVEEVARRIEASGTDSGEAVVVFPGKRPAHFLRQRLAAARNAGFIPPRILSMDSFVDAIFDLRDASAGRTQPSLEPIDAVALLYEIQLAAARPLGGAGFMTLDSFFPLGLRIQRDLEELLIEGVPAAKVAEAQPLLELEVPARSRERLSTLAHFYERFYVEVESRGFSTRSSRYRAVAEQVEPDDVTGVGPLIFAGFSALTGAERTLLRKLGTWPRCQLVFQEGPGLWPRIQGLGVAAPAGALPGAEPPARPATHFYSSPDSHGQVFALDAVLDHADSDTVIVLPRPDTLFPLLRHCLARFGEESYNVSLGYPLRRAPLYGFLDDLMEVVGSMDGERVYLPAYVAFVLHPYAKNVRLGPSAEATRVLFHVIEERLADARTRRFALLEELETDEELFEQAAKRIGAEDRGVTPSALAAHLARIHAKTIRCFRSFANVRDFAQRCLELISWVHDESTARDHPFFAPFSEAFARSLESIARSLLAEKSFNDTASYFTLLRRYLDTCYLPFDGTPLHGLQVLGALETRNLGFARVFVLDANEGVLPEIAAEGSLLPFAVRAALGLATTRDREDIANYHFSLLSAGARELHLFSVEAGEQERSRFVERLLWERQRADRVSDEKRFVRPVQYRVSLASAPPAAVAKSGAVADWLRLREHSATGLDAYLRCPLKFYHRTVLGLGVREESSGEVEPKDIGTFVHDTLAAYLAPRQARPLAREDLDAGAMAALVEQRFAGSFGPAEDGANRLLLAQLKQRMADFVSSYLTRLATSHRLTFLSLERSIAASVGGFALRGRLDAVAELDGTPCLIDWKTSANPAAYKLKCKKLVLEDRATWPEAIPSLQLPFYSLLYAREAGIDPVEVRSMFLLLGRSELDEKIEVPLFVDQAEARTAWPTIATIIQRLLEEIASPEVPFTPTPDLKSACPHCDFTGICGTSWLSER
jgi:ATP-dependent helicase/nuclease subunit B